VAKFEDAVYVLHAFQKKTRKTSQVDIELAPEKALRNGEIAAYRWKSLSHKANL
jgi:phage-related protein